MLVIPAPQRRTLFISHKRTILAILFVFLYSVSISLAVPPTTKYQPGATLDPACAPGDTNCSIQVLPDQTGNANTYLTTDGSDTAWSANTLVLGGNFTTTGAYATTLTTTGITALTLPTSGTLATTANINTAVSGTTNYLPKFTGTNTIGNSLIYDDGTNVGIGDATPSYKLDVAGNVALAGDLIDTRSSNSALIIRGTNAERALTINTSTAGASLEAHGSSTNDLFLGSDTGSGYQALMVQGSTGNVGVGTGSPAYKLVVSNAGVNGFEVDPVTGTASGTNLLSFNRGVGQYSQMNFYARNYTLTTGNVGDAMVITQGGNVGIGTTDPKTKFDTAVANSSTTFTSTLSHVNFNAINTDQTNNNWSLLQFSDDGTAPAAAIGVQYTDHTNNYGQIAFGTRGTTGYGARMSIGPEGAVSVSNLLSCGGIQTNGSGTMSCTSDETLKDIQGEFTSGLEALRDIDPIAFSWKENSGLYDDAVTYYGFSAQNVQGALPQAISLSAGGKLQVSQLTLMAAAINAIKELDIKVEDHTTQFNELNTMDKDNALRANLIAWFANASNQITRIFTGEICLTEPGYAAECISRDELVQLKDLLGAQQTTPAQSAPEPAIVEEILPATDPVIETVGVVEEPIAEPTVEPVPETSVQ